MNEWLIQQGVANPQAGLVVGLLAGLVIAVLLAWLVSRKSSAAGQASLQPRIDELEAQLSQTLEVLADAEKQNAVLEAQAVDREKHFREQKASLEDAEKRLTESFERLSGRIFEQRAEKLSDLNSKQLDALLKPLGEKLNEFRGTVESSHRAGTVQHEVMKQKLGELEKLNERLHEDANNLSKALTSDVKTQGNWGEQQLERLLELSGLQKGKEYSTQISVTTEGGQRVQPDFVMHLPEGKSIILDSKVSLLAWTRYQAAEDDETREAELKNHVASLKQHIKGLGEKRYAEIPELNSLDFVLMFVPIESALIAALQTDPALAEYALSNKVALLSPTNFLATMRTVGSVWAVHRQNKNAQEIARRAGLLYDKFVGFVDNLQAVGGRLRQAQQSYETAFSQLSEGPGNLVRQTEMLSDLGARNTKQLEAALLEEESTDLEPALEPPEDKDPGT
ncbi:MAG: DNA recombination protein RmuC [Xanthomonadales bacterium]|jgi:DNA recombination protein RmuC|nr:DNA recombination protein RmuC [Xanthomonadales bacterium]